MSEHAIEQATGAIVPAEKTDINVPLSAGEDLAAIRSLSDNALVAHITGEIETFITDTDIRFRHFSLRLRPYFAEFHNRFRAEKKAGRPYLGFTDFDRACDAKLHYSGKQVRRIEAGQPTPPKPPAKHETEEEKKSREAKQKLKAAIEREAERLREEREASNAESASLVNEPVPAPIPVVAVNTEKEKQELKEFREIAARNVRALEIADEILPLIYHVSNRKQHSDIKEYLRLRNISVSAIPALPKKASAA